MPRNTVLVTVACALTVVCASQVWAQQASSARPQDVAAVPAVQDLDSLRAVLRAQEQRLNEQARMLEEQRRALEEQRQRLEAMSTQLGSQPQKVSVTSSGAPPRVAQAATAPAPSGSPNEPKKPERQDIGMLTDIGGVLTPAGKLTVEPQLEFTHSSATRYFINGITIDPTALNIGLFEVSEADRDTITAAAAFRYGITNRWEVDARIPYVYRSDTVRETPLAGGATTSRDLSGNDLGDIEFGVHYQINEGLGGWPYFVGNMRVLAPTGTGPYDVDYDAQGIETRLPTGSGFWGFEPSLTVVYPTDPAVLFANVGYLYSVGRNVNKDIAGSRVTDVEPGGSINTSFGIALALNENTSLTLGYEHDYVQSTETTINGVKTKSGSAQVGSLLFGISQALTDNIGVNLNVAIGATKDAPDARVTLRVPITF